MAAALALSLKGIKSHVLEQAETIVEIGAGIQLGPNVFHAFEKLGLEDAISNIAVFVDRLLMMDSLNGETINEVPAGNSIRKRFI